MILPVQRPFLIANGVAIALSTPRRTASSWCQFCSLLTPQKVQPIFAIPHLLHDL
jgi:hypothetical protein